MEINQSRKWSPYLNKNNPFRGFDSVSNNSVWWYIHKTSLYKWILELSNSIRTEISSYIWYCDSIPSIFQFQFSKPKCKKQVSSLNEFIKLLNFLHRKILVIISSMFNHWHIRSENFKIFYLNSDFLLIIFDYTCNKLQPKISSQETIICCNTKVAVKKTFEINWPLFLLLRRIYVKINHL